MMEFAMHVNPILERDENNVFAKVLYADMYEIVQYTGLKDKNGEEGYCHDLVKLFDRSIFEIVWDDDYASFYLKLIKGDELINKHNMLQLRYGEIIGNIYENPELLGGENNNAA